MESLNLIRCMSLLEEFLKSPSYGLLVSLVCPFSLMLTKEPLAGPRNEQCLLFL